MDRMKAAAGERSSDWDATPEELWREWRKLEAEARRKRSDYRKAQAMALQARTNYEQKMDALVCGVQNFGDMEESD